MNKMLMRSIVAFAAGWFFLYGSSVSASTVGGMCGEKDRIISAIGYGTAHSEMLTEGQLQIMAIRAARMDAFRALAEQVQGVQIDGQSTISTLITKSDQLRVRVDAMVRGASVILVNPIQEYTFEVGVELKMSPAMLARAGLCKMEELSPVVEEAPVLAAEQIEEVAKEDEEVVEAEMVLEPLPATAEVQTQIIEESIEEVSPEEKIEQNSERSPEQLIGDGLNMELVEAVRKNQSQAPILLRDAIVGGMDREVALASVLTGMVEPNQVELENVINQAVALGLNREEADRAVNRVKQACSVCEAIEQPSAAPIMEIESGPVEEVAPQSLSEAVVEQQEAAVTEVQGEAVDGEEAVKE